MGHLNLKFIKVTEEDKAEIFITHITMTEEITKIDIDPIVVKGEISMDTIEVDQGINQIIGETILEATQDIIKILEESIVENTGVIIRMKIMEETEVGVVLGKGLFLEITMTVEEMIEV